MLQINRHIVVFSSSRRRRRQDHVLPCNQIIERCTSDPNATDLHVIPMGTAGELWPYFRPNYRQCVDYAEKMETRYDKVVAFIPTGWADSSNWNKQHAISTRQLECRHSQRAIDVEIRLIPYSEHSTCTELVEFVKYCRPRKVIPTVFGDANDRRRLEKLFRPYVDSSRAKLNFFKGMQQQQACSSRQESVAPRKLSAALVNSNHKKTIVQDHVNEATQAETRHVFENDSANSNSNDSCIDLTFSSDENENGDEGTTCSQPSSSTCSEPRSMSQAKCNTQNDVPSKSSFSDSSSSNLECTRSIRKRPSSSRGNHSNKKVVTPPITKFFGAIERK